jgi:hypothetical protein
MFRVLVLFPFSGEGETPTVLGHLERANLNHWTHHVKSNSESCYDRRSFGQSILASRTHLGLPTRLVSVVVVLMWDTLSEAASHNATYIIPQKDFKF